MDLSTERAGKVPAKGNAGHDNGELVPITKKVNVRTGKKVMGVAREHYLRGDIACQSDLCFEGCPRSGAPSTLPENITHYLLPLEDVARNFLDVLDFPDITGVLFLQSVVNPVQLASQRNYRRICQLVRDPSRRSVFFPNEFCKHTVVDRKEGVEGMREWKTRMAFQAANWYYEHLGGQKPIIIVTEDAEIVRRFASKRIEVFVLTLEDYLRDFWATLTKAHDAYQSLRDISAAEGDKGVEDYTDYYKQEVLESGLRQGRFVQGQLHVDKHSNQEAFIFRHGGEKGLGSNDDGSILIPGIILRNRAVHGDVVVVLLLPKSEWRSKLNRLANKDKEEERWERRADVMPTGKVVGIAERNWREYAATIPRTEEENTQTKRSGKRILVYPYDYRIPKIRVLTTQAQKLVNMRIVVQIDNWPVNSQYPNGHFVRCLGKIGDLETEMDGILLENNISVTPFSQGLLSEMPPDNWSPDEDEVAKRKDLRQSHMVMSIDPKGCEDVDDTLSVRRLTNGNLELGVHIADVSFFVPFGGLTDLEARRRATTVYLADRRYDMLPHALSANVCSLLGGVDRYAVSVLWELDPKTYAVISVWYGRTVIRSTYKLSYEAAQDVLDGTKGPEEMRAEMPELASFGGQGLLKKFGQLKETLALLSKVARRIQENREIGGALTLESTEVQFEFEASNLSDIKPKTHLQVHETVAECMIFANHWVAKKISKVFPHQALLRRHPPPKPENFEELKKCAAAKGFKIEIWSNQSLSESLNASVDAGDPTVNLLLRSLATYAMVQALYFSTGSVKPEEWEHYGLALSHYTHFTSPIRRYADIIVHRLLLSALERQDWWSDEPEDMASASKISSSILFANSELQELTLHINDRNRAAQIAQRSSQTLFQTLYFKDKQVDDPRCIVEGVIFSVRANGFLVYIPRYALKGPVYMQNKEGQVLFYRANIGPVWQDGALQQTEFGIDVVPSDGKRQSYKLFDHVTITIQMQGQDSHPHKLVFYLLSKKPPTKGDAATISLAKGEVNFLKEIRKEMEQKDEGVTGHNVIEDDEEGKQAESSKVQKKGRSMYNFFQNMRMVGVQAAAE